MPRTQSLEANRGEEWSQGKATDNSDAMIAAAGAAENAGAVSEADLEPVIEAEMCRLDEEGRRLQAEASRMALDSRPEYEAWFEAGLLLRRASDRLAKIVRRLQDDDRLSDVRSPVRVG